VIGGNLLLDEVTRVFRLDPGSAAAYTWKFSDWKFSDG
jgi:hypothetical protein